MRRAVALLAVVGVLATGCGGNSGASPAPEDVVARVDGRAILVQDVLDHLSPPDPATDVGAPVNPRRQALDAAVRVELFAREAVRRGVEVDEDLPQIVRSRLVQSVVRQELNDANLQREASSAEARRYYEEHPEIFNGDGLSSVSLSTLVVEDAGTAERLLSHADGASDSVFFRLVSRHSVDQATKSRGGRLAVLVDGKQGPTVEQGDDLSAELSGVGWALRRSGQVGLARDEAGRYHVLRADKVEMEADAPDEDMLAYVEGVVEIERRESELQQTEEELRKDADIVIDESTLYGIPVPAW